MDNRIYNFSAGPAVLPLEVLKEAQEDMISYKGSGMSVMEMSHRSKIYDDIFEGAKNDLRTLLSIPDNYQILFLQGGATLQFSMIPLNIMREKADYINTGAWSKKAIKEAKRVGTVNVAATSENDNFSRIPKQNELQLDPEASYIHYTSNNTIFGTEFHYIPEVGNVPLVCDTSSDMLHNKFDVTKFALIYAGAQKNMGPAGATLVIIRDDMLERCTDENHTYLNYKIHSDKKAMYNTPPAYSVYIIGLVYKWLLRNGGLDAMYKMNIEKSDLLYNFIDNSDGYFKGAAAKEDRSLMNVTFNLNSEELEKKLIAASLEKGFTGLKGHRSVGGLRASIYNAFPKEGVETLVRFLEDFKKNN